MIWHIPIEPIEARYSSQWRRWFAEEWPDAGWIDGEVLTDTIEVGSFLDVYGTHHYKASQVMALAKMLRAGTIRDGDVLFFHDLWFPLETVFYMRDGAGVDFRVAGFLHAGAYDPHDFLAKRMGPWAERVEAAWFGEVDKILVFSRFHRDMLHGAFGERVSSRCTVVPFPYRLNEIAQFKAAHKDIQVVWPHRLDAEKNPWVADSMRRQGLQVVTTAGMSKNEYFATLGRARYVASWADQETFGIAVMEGVYLGAMPLLPRRLSYPTLWPDEALFDSVQDMIEAVLQGQKTPCEPGPCQTAEAAFQAILRETKR